MRRVLIIVVMVRIIWCSNHGIELISRLNNFFTFDHNIFLLDSSVDIQLFISPNLQAPQTIYVLKIADINNTGNSIEISTKNTFTVVGLPSSSFDRNLFFLDHFKTILQQFNMKIGFFFSELASINDLKTLFGWCKEHLIVNVFAATYVSSTERNSERLLNIFTFHPFGSLDVINVTSVESCECLFPSIISNFQQHQLRVGRKFQSTFHREFWTNVFRLMNATFIVDVDESNYKSVYDYFEHGTDIFPLWKPQKEPRDLLVYPLGIYEFIIIVPHAQPFSDFSAYLRNFTSAKSLVYAIVTIAVTMCFLTVCRYIKQQKILLFESMIDVLNLLMNDNEAIKYQRLSRTEVLVMVPLTFVGFVIVNGIMSNLQSYVTQPALQPQIKTYGDIYRSKFPILAYGDSWKDDLTEVLENRTAFSDWGRKIFAMQSAELEKHIIMPNASHSFYMDSGTVDCVLEAQKRLNVKGYYNPQLQISKYLWSYLLGEKFLFFDRLNDIIQGMRTAGLIDLWLRQNFRVMELNLLKNNVERIKYLNGKDVHRIEFPVIIVYGWFASVIVLVVEIIWKKIQLSVIE